MFKGTKLSSQHHQLEKVSSTILNKDIGAAKRGITIAANKQAKIDQKHQNILMKMRNAKQAFQIERARRINQLFGRVLEPQETGSAGGGGVEVTGGGGAGYGGAGYSGAGDDVAMKKLLSEENMDDLE